MDLFKIIYYIDKIISVIIWYSFYTFVICFAIYAFIIVRTDTKIGTAIMLIILATILVILRFLSKKVNSPITMEHKFFANLEIENNEMYLVHTNEPSINTLTIYIEYSFEATKFSNIYTPESFKRNIFWLSNPNNTYAWMFPYQYFKSNAMYYIPNYMNVVVYKNSEIIQKYNIEDCKNIYFETHNNSTYIKSLQEIIRLVIDKIISEFPI